MSPLSSQKTQQTQHAQPSQRRVRPRGLSWLGLFVFALSLSVMNVACNSTNNSTQVNTSTSSESSDNLRLTGSETSNNLRLTGSDTMVHLSTQWAEDYMKHHPQANISVNGGGSGNGIAAILNNSTDIAPSSRDIKPDEMSTALKQRLQLQKTPVAIDAIAIIVHKDNPVSSLALNDIQSIYTGVKYNWKDFNGPDKRIIPFSRESSSGTYEFFQEHVLNKQDYTSQTRLIPSTIAIIETVAQDEWSIGYVGLGYALNAKDKVKILAISPAPNKPSIFPNKKTVLSGQYPIARELYLITSSRLKTLRYGKTFMTYCLSPEGQAIVSQAGFLPLQGDRPTQGRHND